MPNLLRSLSILPCKHSSTEHIIAPHGQHMCVKLPVVDETEIKYFSCAPHFGHIGVVFVSMLNYRLKPAQRYSLPFFAGLQGCSGVLSRLALMDTSSPGIKSNNLRVSISVDTIISSRCSLNHSKRTHSIVLDRLRFCSLANMSIALTISGLILIPIASLGIIILSALLNKIQQLYTKGIDKQCITLIYFVIDI